MQRLVRGFSFAVNGFRYLTRHRDLWTISLLPIVLNVLLFVSGVVAFVAYYSRLLHAIVPAPTLWYQWILYAVVAVLLIAVFALVVVFGFTIIGCALAAPFLDTLSERVEVKEGRAERPFALRTIAGDILRSARTAFLVLLCFGVSQVVLLLLWLIPVVGKPVYVVLAPTVGSFFLAFQFFDLPLNRRELRAGGKFRYLWAHQLEAVGFGLAVFLTTLVPLLNFVMLPAAAVGATLLVLTFEREGR